MKVLIAAAAALSVIGGTAAVAQPYDYRGQQDYYDQQAHHGQQAYRGHGQNYGGYVAPAPYGYGQTYTGNAHAYGRSAYYGDTHGARAYGYADHYDRHSRREGRRDRHYVAPRARHDRHH
ncbi:MAG: hypothetical protein ACOY9C_13015 [Pseudomonadota bacterium]|uniref:Uncharacterized protein n=1 Tax=Phenylobacterium conjunctum TaxID=1298959 RepID=A0ABW3T264_9CAUL|nr:hypothetical protein [Phenylobacterium zucineum]